MAGQHKGRGAVERKGDGVALASNLFGFAQHDATGAKRDLLLSTVSKQEHKTDTACLTGSFSRLLEGAKQVIFISPHMAVGRPDNNGWPLAADSGRPRH